MPSKSLAIKDLQDASLNLIEKLKGSGWNIPIKIEDLPKEFEASAVEEVIKRTHELAFEMLSKATGIAFMRGNSTVTTQDAITAIEVIQQGVDNVLPKRDEW